MSTSPRYKKKFSFFKLILISVVIILALIATLMLLNKFGLYKYETTASTYNLPICDRPTKTTVTITYAYNKPKSVGMLWNSGDRGVREYNGYDIQFNDEAKQIIITYDVDGDQTPYFLEIKPADNFKLNLDIAQDISDKYVNAIININDEDPEHLSISVLNYGDTNLFCNLNIENLDASYSKAFQLTLEPGFNDTIDLMQYIEQATQAESVRIIVGDSEHTEKQPIRTSINLMSLEK